MAKEKNNVLVNLPGSFFKTKEINEVFERLEVFANVRKTSHNTPKEIQNELYWADAVIMWAWPELDRETLGKCPNLKFAGHINITKAQAMAELEYGLAVSESRHGFSHAVAEMALALILAGLRRTSDYHASLRAGNDKWESRISDVPLITSVRDRQLTGKKVGIVGFGGIGQRVAELLAPFNNEIRTYDPFLPLDIAEKKGAKLVDMMELSEQSDIIVLCAACNKETKNVMDTEHINALKEGAIVVNVGRSHIVNMDALMKRVKNKDIIAMLDVFDKEPLEKKSPLRKMDNAYLTPHAAGATRESLQAVLNMLIDDLEAFLEGEKRKYAVTKEMAHCLSN